MSWITKLHETYGNLSNLGLSDSELWPISHYVKKAHIEIIIDDKGNFKRTKLLDVDESSTLIPVTEKSVGRTGNPVPHPLCEELGFCATGLQQVKKHKQKKNQNYFSLVEDWYNFDQKKWKNQKLQAIYTYLKNNTLWNDISSGIDFPIKLKKKDGKTGSNIIEEKAFIRWRIETIGEASTGTWEDKNLIESWIEYDKQHNTQLGNCIVSNKNTRIVNIFPKFIRRSGDGTKLISSNDTEGFTYKGKFTEPKQVLEISFEIVQKSHNALRCLINRQSFRNEDQVFVTWAVSCKEIPEPTKSTYDLLNFQSKNTSNNKENIEEGVIDHTRDIGQQYSRSLYKLMAGYKSKLEPDENIVIIGLDSATTGRMAIIYYQENFAHEFIDVIKKWHEDMSWLQYYKKEEANKIFRVVGIPATNYIAEAVYGKRLTKTLKKNFMERIFPCIVEEHRPIPWDIVNACVKHASNPNSFDNKERWKWEQCLSIACSLYKCYSIRHPNINKRRNYTMNLDKNYKSRDYLYGRLLAVAERIEYIALKKADENRPTNAERLMQRFADRPYSTWRNIELNLQPYMQRLKISRPGFIENRKKDLDEIQCIFSKDDYTSDKPLTGEFLLGYHCQRLTLRPNQESKNETH